MNILSRVEIKRAEREANAKKTKRERAEVAFQLHKEGKTYAYISRVLGTKVHGIKTWILEGTIILQAKEIEELKQEIKSLQPSVPLSSSSQSSPNRSRS